MNTAPAADLERKPDVRRPDRDQHKQRAPPAGDYSQAIVVGRTVYTPGQTGLNLQTSQLDDGVEDQVRQAIDNLEAVLRAAGAELNDVVKTSYQTLLAGGTTTVGNFSPSAARSGIADGVTFVAAVPAQYTLMIQAPEFAHLDTAI